jgi:hypothetical protein
MQNSEAKQKLVQLIASRRPTAAVLQEMSKISENAGGIKYVADLINDKVCQAYELIGLFKDRKAYLSLKLFIIALLIQPKELKPNSEDTN